MGRPKDRGLGAALPLVALLVALPLAPIVVLSLAGEWRYPDLLPAAWSLRGWEEVLGGRMPEAVLNSLIVGVGATAVAVAVGVPAGMALGGYRFRGRGLVLFFILLPIIVPPLASTMGIHVTFIRLGLADSVLGVFLVHLVPTVPYTAVILTSVFADRSGELEEAARTLGASPWQAFVHVTLPGVVPGIAVAALFGFLISWSQYILTLLIGGGRVITLPMLLFSAASGSDPVLTATLSVVFALPAIAALLLTLRLLGSGDERNLIGTGRPS